MPRVPGLEFRPVSVFVSRKGGGAVGPIAIHRFDFPGCGVSDALPKTGAFSGRRLGALDAQEKSSGHVGMELLQGTDF